MKRFFSKIITFLLLVSITLTFSSCKKILNEKIETKVVNAEKYERTFIGGGEFEIHNDGGWNGEEIYILSPRTEGQNLSIIVKTMSGELIIFDGGRKEDAEFLANVIMDMGSKVNSWFITHSHDDHVGAIYEILDKYKDDIFVENIYYKFPDFKWAYDLLGNDAGAIPLIEERFEKYKSYIEEKKIEFEVKIHDNIYMNDTYYIDGINVRVMNDMYQIDDDPINNSSVAYKVNIGDKALMILGDLSYEGGNRLLEDNPNNMKSNFVVMAHHGQGGVGKEVYDAINPEYCIWCTTHKIFNNLEDKYETDNTKTWMTTKNIKKHYITLYKSFIIR